MTKRKTIYKGFNKRKKRTGIKIIVITMSIFIIGGYSYRYIKTKDVKSIFSQITNLVSSLQLDLNLEKFMPEKNKAIEYTYDDIKKEVETIKDNENNKSTSEEVKIAKVDSWSIYTVQVASIDKEEELKKIETKLNDNKIPFSVIEIDGLKKVQTYGSFDKSLTRQYLENMRKLYPDAFLSESNIPVLSLEYTSKYSYVESISNQLNKLIKNYEQESEFWKNNNENIDLSLYKNILTSRKQITEEIKKDTEKIDYKEMNTFKENLVKYINSIDDKIDLSSKLSNEGKYQVSQSLFLSCMQEYLEFINSIK